MPHKDPTKRKVCREAYRVKHKAALAEKERLRVAKKISEDKNLFRRARQEANRRYRAKHGPSDLDRQRNRNWYQRVRNDPIFQVGNRSRAAFWAAANRGWVRVRAREYVRKLTRNNLAFRLRLSIRRRFYMAVRNRSRTSGAIADLGCTIDFLEGHLESLFRAGMTWGNWSRRGWHIDHIRPLSKFDLSDPHQRAVACHWSNLQPLWANENLRKGARQGA